MPALRFAPATLFALHFSFRGRKQNVQTHRALSCHSGGAVADRIAITLVYVIGSKGSVPSKTILEANFEQPFAEQIPDSPTAHFTMNDRETLRDVIDAIDRGSR